MIDSYSAAESTRFFYLVAACAYGTVGYVKALHQAFKKTKDPLPKMLDMATFYNRPEIVKFCIRDKMGERKKENRKERKKRKKGNRGQGVLRTPYDLNDIMKTAHSDETFKVLCERVLDSNAPTDFHGDILQCAVKNDYLDWVRFCLKNHVNLAPENNNSNKHPILAIAATYASIEISELLIVWGGGRR